MQNRIDTILKWKNENPNLGCDFKTDTIPISEWEDRLLEKGIRLVTRWDAHFPKCLLVGERVPEVISFRGDLSLLYKNCLSAVGSRKLSTESQAWIEIYFREFLQATNIPVVSGGAIGADQFFHRACVRAGTPTICFLPSGILNPYPQNVIPLMDDIVSSGGLVVSQFPPHMSVQPWMFHVRNQLIAASGKSLFVVEARRRSGSIMTATKALNLGKDIGVVPHSPSRDCNDGGLDLLVQGARMILDARDLSDFFAASTH